MKLYISKCETAPNNITVWEQSRVFQTHVPAEPTAFLLGLAALRQEGCPAASGLPVSVWQAAVTGFPVVRNSDLPGSSCPFPKTPSTKAAGLMVSFPIEWPAEGLLLF